MSQGALLCTHLDWESWLFNPPLMEPCLKGYLTLHLHHSVSSSVMFILMLQTLHTMCLTQVPSESPMTPPQNEARVTKDYILCVSHHAVFPSYAPWWFKNYGWYAPEKGPFSWVSQCPLPYPKRKKQKTNKLWCMKVLVPSRRSWKLLAIWRLIHLVISTKLYNNLCITLVTCKSC